MVTLILALLTPNVAITASPVPVVFSADERAILSAEVERSCGFSGPDALMDRSEADRQKALPCLIEATIQRSAPMLPKTIEPGVTLVSAELFQTLPVFVLQFAPEHPRALVPKDQSSPYDEQLSTRTCNDRWLGGIIDAGVVRDKAGAVIVFKMTTEKGGVFAAMAVAKCFDPK